MAATPDLECNGNAATYTEPFAPGTVLLEDVRIATGHGNGHLVFQPQPSDDPNDPLNWSNRRKYINFGIISFYALMIFTILDIGPVVWQDYVDDLNLTYDQLDQTFAANCAGLAFGCIIFIPFALKYGRRPVYIISTIITFAMAVWQAELNTYWEMMATQVISGLSGAVSETIVQMTVADVFFVHQRGTMNGIYLLMVSIGTFLAPVASGYIGVYQGWRWLYWWCTIFLGINVLLFIFCYEETKFIYRTVAHGRELSSSSSTSGVPTRKEKDSKAIDNQDLISSQTQPSITEQAAPHTHINHSIPLKTYRERLPWTTVTPSPWKKLIRHSYQPFIILATIPAVAYSALLYGSALAWFSILATTQANYFSLPPYNFSTIGIGLLNLPAFIGCLLGSIYGGPLSDYSIVVFSRRNKGVYEPEMRLWLSVFPALLAPAGLWIYGYGTAAGMPWIIPSVGAAIFGFTLTSLGDTSLTYLSDSYREILGDALVGIAFVRNLVAAIVMLLLTPWINSLGLHGTFTSVGCLCLGLNLTIVPMILWGKKLRILCAVRYKELAQRQFDAKAI